MANLKMITRIPGIISDNCMHHISKRNLSNNYARISTTCRPLYKRMFPTLFISPDGSSFTSRFHEPRQVVKLPLDISTLTEAERLKWLARRKPVKKMTFTDDVKSTFKSKQYIDLVKKKK